MGIPELTSAELVLRICAAGALGAVVGLEREFSGQPAGFRTHMLVSLGSALFTMVGAYGITAFYTTGHVGIDPTRVAAQVVTGIGFLGAGAILRQGVNVRGLTTAAALWVTAAIGMSVGLGYWTGAIATTILTLIALYGLKRVQQVLLARVRKGTYQVSILVGPDMKLSTFAQRVEDAGAKIERMNIFPDEEGLRRLVGAVHLPPGLTPDLFAQDLATIEGVEDVDYST
jgi:putative Mg2+ transporter-C (MgtC) family protein